MGRISVVRICVLHVHGLKPSGSSAYISLPDKVAIVLPIEPMSSVSARSPNMSAWFWTCVCVSVLRQKTHMKNNNGRREVAEKMLFHGTDNKHVDVICRSNFDWRLCGVHGTLFGKGESIKKCFMRKTTRVYSLEFYSIFNTFFLYFWCSSQLLFSHQVNMLSSSSSSL